MSGQASTGALRAGPSLKENLMDFEEEWRDRSPFLETRGYILRPRLRPGWSPSWYTSGKTARESEDAIWSNLRPNLMDATRKQDGKLVYIKKVKTEDAEFTIACHLFSDDLRKEPNNHSVPILETFSDPHDPSTSYMVMPYLRPLDDPSFQHVGEVLDCGEQLLEGLTFLHDNGIAHRDCSEKNILADCDAMYPRGFHPVHDDFLPDISDVAPHNSRISIAVKYYFIDYDISTQVTPGTHSVMVVGTLGREQEVPELSDGTPYDAFKVDIFTIGRVFRRVFHNKYSNVEFVVPFIEAMTRDDPSSRPTAAECLAQWRSMRRSFSTLSRHWRLKAREEPVIARIILDCVHGVRVVGRLLQWARGQRFPGA